MMSNETYTESKTLFEGEVGGIDWREKALEFERENMMLKEDIVNRNNTIKKLLNGRVEKRDRKSWMNLSFGVNIRQAAEKIFKSLI